MCEKLPAYWRGLLAVIFGNGVALAAPRIQITGLRCDAPGDDNKNLNAEYVVVKNFSKRASF